MQVNPIKPADAYPWMLQKHYAKRLCPVEYAFGLFDGDTLVGVVTYGTPASAPLRSGVCGPEHADKVLELNRLVCEHGKNNASMLIGRSLAMLPAPAIVVSFADSAQGHVGYVYQATNWIYTGLSAKRTDWKIRGLEHLHGATVADMSRGHENRADFMREKYGDDFYLQDRPQKHRYVFFIGSRSQKAALAKALRYPVMPYPKGESARYDDSAPVATQRILF